MLLFDGKVSHFSVVWQDVPILRQIRGLHSIQPDWGRKKTGGKLNGNSLHVSLSHENESMILTAPNLDPGIHPVAVEAHW